jgi:hypothetical protein
MLFLLIQHRAIAGRFEVLRGSVERVIDEWNGPESILEESEDYPGFQFTVFSSGGLPLARTGKNAPSLLIGERIWNDRIYYGAKRGGLTVVGSASWSETASGLNQLLLLLAGLWLPLTFLTAAIAWYGGGLVLRPVGELVDSAKVLSTNPSTELLETTDSAEFALLAQSLNELITRVRKSGQVQEQFATDAAHELRNPLAVLKARIEFSLLKPRTPDQYQTALSSMLDSVDRLAAIVETLLATARSDPKDVSPLSLGQHVQEIVDEWRYSAGERAPNVETNLEMCHSAIALDELRIIMRNLLDNASRHSPQNTSIIVTLSNDNTFCALQVRDFGSGLPLKEQELAFARLYRVDQGRNRRHGGAGIGLALVRRIIESRGGNVNFQPTEVGACVLILLPSVTSQSKP